MGAYAPFIVSKGISSMISSCATHTYGDFDVFMDQIRGNVPINSPLFNARIDFDIWLHWLHSFPIEDQNEYNCNCCKRFIREFGGLLYIDIYGQTHSALWDTSKEYGYFNQVVRNMRKLVEGRDIEGQVIANTEFLGRPKEGGWSHLAITAPAGVKRHDLLKTDKEQMAERKEEFRMLNRALDKYDGKVANAGYQLLLSEKLHRPEIAEAHAKWFCTLINAIDANPKHRRNIVWGAVAEAPVGFAHVSTSVFGSLMDELMKYKTSIPVIKGWNAKVDGLAYRRPQTAPGAQNVKRGEEIFNKLGLAPALERRYARLDDLDLCWQPKRSTRVMAPPGGVFGSVKTRQDTATTPTSTQGSTTMTWARFARKILPMADKIKVFAPAHGNYSSLCAPVHADAPTLFQWSNGINWYVYSGGSSASQWNLRQGWKRLTGICEQPNMWLNECPNRGEGIHFLIEDCAPRSPSGLALFPETMKSELHEIRKTIESYSNGMTMQGREQASACGLKFSGSDSVKLQVTSDGVTSEYVIDRMD